MESKMRTESEKATRELISSIRSWGVEAATIRSLVERGADVNAWSQDMTLLMCAAGPRGRAGEEAVRTMLELGADVNARAGSELGKVTLPGI